MPEISEIVRISSRVIPRGELRKTFGVTLFITTDNNDVLSAVGPNRIRTYSSLSEVGADFPTDSEPYLAAKVYFAQEPFPKALMVGRWAKANVPSRLVSGVHEESAPTAAMMNASATYSLIGKTGTINSASTAADTWAKLALLIQADLRAAPFSLNNITCTWNAATKRLEIEDPNYSNFDGLMSAASTGTDISGALKFDTAGGAISIRGSDANMVSEALVEIEDLDSSFYFVTVEKGENDERNSRRIDTWVAATNYHAILESNDDDALTTSETSSEAATISGKESPRTCLVWSSTAQYLSLSVAARLSGVNLSGANSLITLNLKQMPNITPDSDLTTTQINELTRKNMNYYTKFGSSSAFRDGRNLKPGIWTDVRFFLDWFVDAAQTAAFNALYSSNRIPQTPSGMATIREAIEGVCRNAIRNGGVAPGTVQPSTKADIITVTGNEEFNGFLSNGYLIHAGSLADQSQAARNNREAPQFRVWLKGSGAIHEIDIDITMEQ